MAKLGSPQTKKFQIGTAELRIGAMADANKLKQTHSVGLIDSATIEVTQTSVDLLGGFPRTLQDTAVVSQESTVNATLREYSRRNIKVMLGEGLDATSPADTASLVITNESAGATTVTVTGSEGADFDTGDIIVIYPEGRPEEVTVARVASELTDVITLDADTPTLYAYDGTAETIHVYQAHQVSIGDANDQQYMAVQLIQQERATGRPIVFNFWKAAISSSMSFATNAEDFASTEFQLKLLQPAASEYGAGQPLEHLADIIPSHPTGMYIGGGD